MDLASLDLVKKAGKKETLVIQYLLGVGGGVLFERSWVVPVGFDEKDKVLVSEECELQSLGSECVVVAVEGGVREDKAMEMVGLGFWMVFGDAQ